MRRPERGNGRIRIRRACERSRGRTQDLVAGAIHLTDVNGIRRMPGYLREPLDRRLPHIVLIVRGELLEQHGVSDNRCRARGVHPHLPDERRGERSERRCQFVRR